MECAVKVFAVLLIFVSQLAFAQGDVANCTDEKGYTYYPNFGGVTPKNKKTWREESTTGKKIVVTNNNGQYDLIYSDTKRNQVFSALQEGAKISLISKTPNEFSLLVVFIGSNEIYSFRTSDDGKFEYVHTLIRSEMIPKISAAIGACQQINFQLVH
ncbi:hypothetical protein AOC33_00030 [Polynucleobacter cosmopolitanus]|uniref:DUF4124 domain-containing protein n=1 Tax=Polynucleobacter cosmopolitanus TaxID=351345 RepID=A0A229FU35_9BURK|nr:hypothetical protein AOC33_00030 [Polynucleobacter cosmopolitanus]